MMKDVQKFWRYALRLFTNDVKQHTEWLLLQDQEYGIEEFIVLEVVINHVVNF